MSGKLKVLDLFSGIGGFSLGLERTGGFETVAFCEIEKYPRDRLADHWPEVPCYHDIRELSAARLAADGIFPNFICGGFPCQDISVAWNGPGIEGARSGLWGEYARLIGEIRPAGVIVENVSALLARGLGRVLGDLAALGYDAEWDCLPAAFVGAPHIRDRLWLVAYPHAGQCIGSEREICAGRDAVGSGGQDLAHAMRERRDQMEQPIDGRPLIQGSVFAAIDAGQSSGWRWWETEPDVGRVADGVPARVDRIKGLGNAVVPQIPEMIGRAILESLAA